MRILHIIPNLRKGGAERLVLDICNELLKDTQNQVLLITFSPENAYKELYPDVPIKVVPASVNLSVLGTDQYHTDALQQEIETFAPDIIHTHLFEAEIVSRSCLYTKAKWFSHAHSNMPAFQNFSGKTLLEKAAFTRYYEKRFLFSRYRKNGGNSFIAISNATKAYLEKTAESFPIYLLPNAINYSRFFTHKTYVEGQRIRLINVGSLVANKNQTFLLDVAAVLADKGVDFELHLLGDGVLRESLTEKINHLGLAQRVVLHGNIDRVEELLWQTDIYVHSAKSEALGLTQIEAMAAGLPVITLDGKGNRDLIEEGKNGYLFFDADVHSFAQRILSLWADREAYVAMSTYAQAFAKRYDISTYITQLLALYRR